MATATEAPATEVKDKPPAEGVKASEGPQASAPFQPILPVPPQAVALQVTPLAAQPAAPPSKAGDAVPSTRQGDSTTPVAGMDGRQPASTLMPAAAQVAAQTAAPSAAPSASTLPPRAAAPSGAVDAAAPAAQKHPAAVVGEAEPSAAPAILTDAAPLPAAAPASPPNAAPTPAPVSIAPHPAPAPSQVPAPAHSSAAGAPPPPPAAAQVGPVLASFAASAAHPGAPQQLTIRLDPLDLGRVQVRIERAPDGSARVDLKVEKPDTLLLLLRDQPQLHRALDLAGVPSTERTLQFHLAPPDTPTPNAQTTGGTAAQSNAGHGHGQQRPGQPHSGRSAMRGTAISSNEPMSGPAAFRRAGVDITA